VVGGGGVRGVLLMEREGGLRLCWSQLVAACQDEAATPQPTSEAAHELAAFASVKHPLSQPRRNHPSNPNPTRADQTHLNTHHDSTAQAA